MRRRKSKSLRKVFRRTPGGRTVEHYEPRKPKKAHCAGIGCDAVLKGVPRERPHKMQNMPKTKKRPSRPYGGVLCSRCMRLKITQEARKKEVRKEGITEEEASKETVKKKVKQGVSK